MRKRGRPPHPDVLTPREWEVLSLIRDGLTNEQIAERIGVTIHAARYHVSQILSKLGVATREESAAWQPEEVRSHRFERALQIGLTLAAALAVLALGVLGWSVLRESGDDNQVGAIRSTTPTATLVDTTFLAGPPKLRAIQLISETAGLMVTNKALVMQGVPPKDCQDSECIESVLSPRNITPGGVAPGAIRGFYFLDAQRGWLVANQNADNALRTAQLFVFRTDDGGDSWTSVPLGQPGFNYWAYEKSPGSVQFANKSTGWIWLTTGGDSTPIGELWGTEDGGVTWELLQETVEGGVRFANETEGWSAFYGTGDIPPGASYVAVTHDGGRTWEKRSFPEDLVGAYQTLPTATDDGRVLMPFTQFDADDEIGYQNVSILRLYESRDDGSTWSELATSEDYQPVVERGAWRTNIFPDGTSTALRSRVTWPYVLRRTVHSSVRSP